MQNSTNGLGYILENIQLLFYNNVMDYAIIGKQIAKGRKDKGLSQAGLAMMLNVTPQAVSKWERGESLPDIFMLAKISDIFGVYDIGYFIGQVACPCCDFNKNKEGISMNQSCEGFTTIEQFVEYWESCSVKGLQKIAEKYGVPYGESDTKEMLVKKLKDGMMAECGE
ncbi:MAG: helix-turn-helix transcriptional regulator [Bacillota bacterium]|nr:helix-turn-helix transcriptional regulator [Bacillota bacterium]